MPLVASRSNASAKAFGWSSAPSAEVLGGMVLMTPTSIASTGTGNSSSIGANGSVTFSSCETLSLNGVFTSEYDNYMIVSRMVRTGTDTEVSWYTRLRLSGTDSSTGYTDQYLYAASTTISGGRSSTRTAFYTTYSDAGHSGFVMSVYGPYLAQPTAVRSITVAPEGGISIPSIWDDAGTHSASTSYDGITFYGATAGRRVTGLVSVYGLGG